MEKIALVRGSYENRTDVYHGVRLDEVKAFPHPWDFAIRADNSVLTPAEVHQLTENNLYYAVFVDTAANRAWIRGFDPSEPPQEGCHSGQSYGEDKAAAEAVLKRLEAEGYNK